MLRRMSDTTPAKKPPKKPPKKETKQFSLYKKVNIYALRLIVDLAPRQ